MQCSAMKVAMGHALQMKHDDQPPHVVSVLMHKLNAHTEDEIRWLESSVSEMVAEVASFLHSPQAMRILKETLPLGCLGSSFLEKKMQVSQKCLRLRVSMVPFD